MHDAYGIYDELCSSTRHLRGLNQKAQELETLETSTKYQMISTADDD